MFLVGFEQYLCRVVLRGSGKNNLLQCVHFLLLIIWAIGLTLPWTNGAIMSRIKKENEGRKNREENQKKRL
jgi:hypothetical protein